MTLQQYIPDSVIVFNRKIRHCASLFNDGVYDIRGRIPSGGFWIATAEDMQYMQKHFMPSFDAEVLEIRLLVDYITIYSGIGFEYVKVGSLSVRDSPEIVEVGEDKKSMLWGRLKSGDGWVHAIHLKTVKGM